MISSSVTSSPILPVSFFPPLRRISNNLLTATSFFSSTTSSTTVSSVVAVSASSGSSDSINPVGAFPPIVLSTIISEIESASSLIMFKSNWWHSLFIFRGYPCVCWWMAFTASSENHSLFSPPLTLSLCLMTPVVDSRSNGPSSKLNVIRSSKFGYSCIMDVISG